LLIGEFGDAPDDPPVLVQIVSDLLSDGTPPVNFKTPKQTRTRGGIAPLPNLRSTYGVASDTASRTPDAAVRFATRHRHGKTAAE
jgi:hypothetical protein